MNEPQLHDTVIDGGRWYRIVAFSEDRGTKLDDGRWVCASKFAPVTRACWRYEPRGSTKPASARETLTTTLTNLLARTRNGRMDAHRAEAERLVEEALKEHAHELAEEIRRDVDAGKFCVSEVDGAWEAADRIDPVEARCVGCGSPQNNGQAHGYGAEFGGCV
ncbi:MAG TPA: hypothetical protein VK545_09965 [Streptomyces sp.]|nr:hypothetical protein [Streptomyces sp.]